MSKLVTDHDAVSLAGRLLAWAEADRPFVRPEIMTAEEAILLSAALDVDGLRSGERLLRYLFPS